MMLIIKELREQDIPTIITWSRDETVKSRIAIDNWYKYFEYVNSCENYFIFGVCNDDVLIGELSAEVVDDCANIALIIAPEMQNRGIGSAALKLFCGQIHILFNPSPSTVCAAIEADNTGSINCFENAGFVYSSTDKDGLLIYKMILLK